MIKGAKEILNETKEDVERIWKKTERVRGEKKMVQKCIIVREKGFMKGGPVTIATAAAAADDDDDDDDIM